MVFDQRPDEVFLNAVSRGVENLKKAITGVSNVIRTGDEALKNLDSALTGGQPKFGETPQESFMTVLEMLHGTLEDARESKSASADTVVQKSRQILARINQVEPAWRSGPMGIRTTADVFRSALRDLRASDSLLKLAQGQGSLEDLRALSTWADDLKDRLEAVKAPSPSKSSAQSSPKSEPAVPAEASKSKSKKPKKDTTPKTVPNQAEVRYAQAVAEEYGDSKVKGWAKEYAEGKISEEQWISRLTTHAAGERDTLDDILGRATQRINRENDANKETQPEEK